MADIEISVDAGTSKRLLTAGKYCDKNILVSASGGGSTELVTINFPNVSQIVPYRIVCVSDDSFFEDNFFYQKSIKINKNSILYIRDDTGGSFNGIGDCQRSETYIGAGSIFFVQGDCSFSLDMTSGGSPDAISDTEALNIITGGEEV